MDYSRNGTGLAHWVVFNQFGDLLTGPGAARDNVTPSTLTKINKDEHRTILKARRFSMECSLKHALKKQEAQKHIQQQQQIQRQRAMSIMCKIYVGSIYYEIGEQTIKQAFDTFGPVRSIDMSYDGTTQRHKGFCFIEFETPEAAHLALEHMQSVTIGGRAVKVGRLSNIGQAQHFIQQFAAEAAKYHRIYIANVHANLQDNDIRDVFESFGKVVSCALVRNPDTGQHNTYGFLEYTEQTSMKEAITAMNGFDLGGNNIRVGPCVVPPKMHNMTSAMPSNPNNAIFGALKIQEMLKKSSSKSTSSSKDPSDSRETEQAGGNVPKSIRGLPQTIAEAEGNNYQISGSGQRNMLIQKLMRGKTTRVLVLKNMLTADQLDADVEGEVTEECSTYGRVLRVVIYQEKQSEDINAETIVKIFVEFSDPEEVQNAINALSGRYFSGSRIIAMPYDQNLFEMKDYTQN